MSVDFATMLSGSRSFGFAQALARQVGRPRRIVLAYLPAVGRNHIQRGKAGRQHQATPWRPITAIGDWSVCWLPTFQTSSERIVLYE